jgi:5-keto 4-deoxyuronate isomerase
MREGETMEHSQLTAKLTVSEVTQCWLNTIPTFVHYRMAYVGFPIAHVETLADVAVNYDLRHFLIELEQTICLDE